MAKVPRGRHRSTCKAGKRAIAELESIPGVIAVIIGISVGGKSLGSGRTGDVKVQRAVPGGFKGLLQSSRGIQEIFIRVDADAQTSVRNCLMVKGFISV